MAKAAAGLPAVLIGHAIDAPTVSSVYIDEAALGKMAAEHFVDLGLEYFAFVAHGDWPFVAERRKGFAAGVKALGYGPVHELTGAMYDRRRRRRFERDMTKLLTNLPHPCGLLAANDILGVEIVSACRNLNIRVPEDVAVLGVDDDEMACELSEVPLSSVEQPLQAIGYEAARVLHQHMEDPNLPPTRMLLPPVRVVRRASSDLFALNDPDVVAALHLINDHAAEPINVAWVVRQLAVARRSLQRRFKTVVGRTLLAQIQHVRLQKAKELLSDSDLSLELVAQQSGLANARWMADCFRKELGVTPLRYRRQFRMEN